MTNNKTNHRNKFLPALIITAYLPLAVLGRDYTEIGRLVGEIVRVLLFLMAGYYGIKVGISIFVGQIDLATGKPGALSDVIMQIISSVLLLALAYQAPAVGESAASIVGAQDNYISMYSVTSMIDALIIQPMLSIVITLAISVSIIAIVVYGFRGQMGALTGAANALSGSISGAITAVLLVMFGLLGMRVIFSIFT